MALPVKQMFLYPEHILNGNSGYNSCVKMYLRGRRSCSRPHKAYIRLDQQDFQDDDVI